MRLGKYRRVSLNSLSKILKRKLWGKYCMYSKSKYRNRMGMPRSTKWYKDCHCTWFRKYFSGPQFQLILPVLDSFTGRRRGCSLPRPRDRSFFPWRRRQRRRNRDFFCDLVLAAHFKCSKAVSLVTSRQNKPKLGIHIKRLMLNSFQSLFLCDMCSKHHYYAKCMRTDTITEIGGKKV